MIHIHRKLVVFFLIAEVQWTPHQDIRKGNTLADTIMIVLDIPLSFSPDFLHTLASAHIVEFFPCISIDYLAEDNGNEGFL